MPVRSNILLLEDNADRLNGFKTAVAQLGPQYQLFYWRDAHRMIAECHTTLASACLISLDNDLDKEHPHSSDPGEGVHVAEFLSKLPCLCPVILHTSNADRRWSMHNEFRFGGWASENIMPLGDDWIGQSWFPAAQRLIADSTANESPFFKPRLAEDHADRLARAVLSLHGLAIGDGIGEMMFSRPEKAFDMIMEGQLPAGPWWHTDDTEMAISIVETLRLLGFVHQDTLARQFAWRFEKEPDRGYGSGARRQLRSILEGVSWRDSARDAFSGMGSLGNGSAMRVAPLGAWYADDLDQVVSEARASAMVTHMHQEGVAGAIAIAVAAAMAWRLRGQSGGDAVKEFINEIHQRTPDGETRRGIESAFRCRQFESPQSASRILGNGSGITCPDTVPFTIWAAAKHLGNFLKAIAATASVGGDVDTNCAIVGGIVALSLKDLSLPDEWLKEIEKLPYHFSDYKQRSPT